MFFAIASLDSCVKYLKVFTFLTKEEITAIEKDHLEHLGSRIAQKVLAYEVTKIIHGENKAIEAKNISEALFKEEFSSLTKENIEELYSSYSLTIHSDLKVEDLLIEIKAASSKREAREFIKNNAVSINGKKYNDANYVLAEQDYLYSKYLIVKRGKKNYYLVKKES